MDFKGLAEKRYSVRKFSSKPVEQDKIDQILETARLAPTACNNQPQRIKIITEKSQLELVDACAKNQTFGAPLVFLVCYDKTECWKRKYDGALSGDIDAAIVTTHIIYQAQELGLGSVWLMHFDPAKTRELFNLAENIVPIAFLPVGYPTDDCKPHERLHFTRKPLEDILI